MGGRSSQLRFTQPVFCSGRRRRTEVLPRTHDQGSACREKLEGIRYWVSDRQAELQAPHAEVYPPSPRHLVISSNYPVRSLK